MKLYDLCDIFARKCMQTAYKKLCLEKILMYEVCLLFMSVKYEESIILCYSVMLFVVMMVKYDDMDR